ncbi:MAG: DUF6800 family protein [Pirellula sp.]
MITNIDEFQSVGYDFSFRFKDNLPQFLGFKPNMAGTERQREIRRRRTRKKKLALLHKKSEKSSKQEKLVIADKIRRLTPGGEQLIKAWKLS